jgi:hypothetical protein
MRDIATETTPTAAKKLELDRPVFIVGSASSGTTLLSVMLDRHSVLACGPELFVFDKPAVYGPYDVFRDRLGDWLRDGLVGDGQVKASVFFHSLDVYYCEADGLVRLAREADDLRGFFDRFFAAYLERRGKQRWVEKTGSNAYCFAEILRRWPEARMVHIVRDGRDVVCSLLQREADAYHAASHWAYNVAAGLAWRGHPAYLEVKYESLVREPRATLKRVCRHLGVAFEPGMLAATDDAYWHRQATGAIHASWNADPRSGEISTRSIGRHAAELSNDVAALFWRLKLTRWARRRLGVPFAGVRELMRTLGYGDGPPAGLGQVPWMPLKRGLRDYWRRVRAARARGEPIPPPLTTIGWR